MAVERDLIEGRPSRPDAPLARYPHVLANGFDFTEERMRRDKLVDSLTRQIPADARLGEDSREKLRAAFKLLASHPDLTPAGRVAAIAEVARKANHRAVYEIALKSLFNLYDFVPQSTYAADHGVTDRGLKFSYAPCTLLRSSKRLKNCSASLPNPTALLRASKACAALSFCPANSRRAGCSGRQSVRLSPLYRLGQKRSRACSCRSRTPTSPNNWKPS